MSATVLLQRLNQEYEAFKKSIYFKECSLPHGINPNDIVEIPWQPLDVNIKHREFFTLKDGDVLCHFYGFMVFRLL
jgi:hypothetical protein